jgi:hypothetical protein
MKWKNRRRFVLVGLAGKVTFQSLVGVSRLIIQIIEQLGDSNMHKSRSYHIRIVVEIIWTVRAFRQIREYPNRSII